jgi:hypothetical protein
MRASRRRTRTGEVVATVPATRAGAGSAEVDPGFHRAILKIALELRRPGAQSYDALVESTIQELRIDPAAFRRYLGENGARNMSLLLATARRFGP